MKYVFFCSLVGAGTSDPYDPYEPAVRNYSKIWKCVDGRADATLGAGEMMVETEMISAEYAAAIADPAINEPLPIGGLSLSDPVSSLTTTQIQAAKAFFESRHIPTEGINGTDTIASVLRKIIRRYIFRQLMRDLDFAEGLDTLISDIPAARRSAINTRLQSFGFDTSQITGGMTIRQGLKTLFDQRKTLNIIKKRFRTHLDGI